MESNSKIKSALNYLTRPWVIETIIFCLVLYQESFRLSARTANRLLPVSKQLQDFYYFNFGDFVNGYVIAYMADGLINMLLFKSDNFYRLAGIQISKRANTLFATLFSSIIIIVFELSGSGSTTSDLMDIPAGILGAILFYLIRQITLKIAESNRQV